MADMCYECQFSNTGYFCRFMEHGVCTATSCKWMIEFESRETYKLLNGTKESTLRRSKNDIVLCDFGRSEG